MKWIDKAKEIRPITQLERLISAVIRQRHTNLAVLEEDVWRQRARTRWELHGDRGTKYFHAVASRSKRFNTISQIEHEGVQYSDQTTKAAVFFEFFTKLMGSEPPPTPTISWSNLYPEATNLDELAAPITTQEIAKAISQWPNNKVLVRTNFRANFINISQAS